MTNSPEMNEVPALALSDSPPAADTPTDYDWANRICYLRLLDADADGADWREVARTVMQLDPEADPRAARASWKSHLNRAKWMATHGYRDYLGTAAAPGDAHPA